MMDLRRTSLRTTEGMLYFALEGIKCNDSMYNNKTIILDHD